jgi:hypothetical protein
MANSLKSLFKTGFGLGLGIYAVQVLFLLLGLAFFLPGYSMFQKAKKEDKEKVVPFALMAVGVVIMGGAGLGILVDGISDL